MYVSLCYPTIKKIAKLSSISDSERNDLDQDLLHWVSCTFLLYAQAVLDVVFDWVPLYSFMKLFILGMVFSQRGISIKLLSKMEGGIVMFEEHIDVYIDHLSSYIGTRSCEFLAFLIDSLESVIEQASKEELVSLQKACDLYIQQTQVMSYIDNEAEIWQWQVQ